MLGVPTPSFPAPASQQRASSTGRSKVPLKPGRSLMDWIQLTKSGKDLTGLQGRLLEVTEKELAKHNRKEDCWTCIRGLVYNVTPYMEYHPGGEEELMKAAGADGTDLFDQVHRWVNYESMLKECLVGKMAIKLIPAAKEIHSHMKEKWKLVNGVFSTPGTSDKSDRAISPRYDWFQTDAGVTVVIYIKQKNIASESVIVDLEDGVLRTEVIIDEYTYLLHIELSNEVDKDVSVHIPGTVGKFEVKLKKKNNKAWKDLGKALGCHNTFMKRRERELFFRTCKLVSVAKVSYNTKVFCLEMPQGTHLQVPVGHHVYLKHSIKGTEIIRPYTPITHYLEPCVEETSQNSSGCVYLMIKIYPSGVLTPQIDSLQIGDFVHVSNPEGTFQESQLQGVTDLFLLAAGTGFTPMVKVINFALRTVSCLRKSKLLFFNKTEEDILWRDKVEELELMDKRFSAEFILSEPSDRWNGKCGRISLQLLSEFLTRQSGESKPFICICGPTPFTEEGVRCVQELGYSKEDIHAFTG